MSVLSSKYCVIIPLCLSSYYTTALFSSLSKAQNNTTLISGIAWFWIPFDPFIAVGSGFSLFTTRWPGDALIAPTLATTLELAPTVESNSSVFGWLMGRSERVPAWVISPTISGQTNPVLVIRVLPAIRLITPLLTATPLKIVFLVHLQPPVNERRVSFFSSFLKRNVL